MSASIMNGADHIYHMLKAAGVDVIFGVPSQQNLMLYDALARHRGIRAVGARHEQGAVHAADGYARATGRLGVAIVSTGPGTTNAMTGLYEAAFASSRVLLITTQVDRIHLNKDRGFIHQADRQLQMLQTVVRRAERANAPHEIAERLGLVMADILSGRPQPGAFEIPTDLLGAPAPERTFEFKAPAPLQPAPGEIAAAAGLLAGASRPLIVAGGGCASPEAAAALRSLAEKLNAPVLTTPNGRGAIPPDHPLLLGIAGMSAELDAVAAQADCVLAVGTRFQVLATGFYNRSFGTLIHLDADPSVIGRTYKPEIAIISDAAEGLAALDDQLPGGDRASWIDTKAVQATLWAENSRIIGPDHSAMRDAVRRILPNDAIVVADATMAGTSWGIYGLAGEAPRSAFYSTSLAIGPALPIGIGAALGTGRTTLVIHGDGGVMLNLAELATAAETGVPLICCIFNDRGYGVLKAIQEATTGRPIGVELLTPDFVAVAEAMGISAARTHSVDGFAALLEQAVTRTGPYVIEIDISGMEPIVLR